MSRFNLSEIKYLKGYSVEWDAQDSLIISNRNKLYKISKDNSLTKVWIGEFPIPVWHSILIRFKLLQRLLRSFFYNVVVLKNNDIFVTYGKSIGLIKDGGEFISLSGIDRPFRVLRNAIAQDSDGTIYFGEYFSNPQKGFMRIYKYIPENLSVEIAYTFEEKSIRHIHGIYFDEYTNSLWCVTGDLDHECKFIQTFDGFKTFKVIGSGDETWRAVSILFTRKYIYYAMDAEFQQNKIFKILRHDNSRVEIGDIDGPVYYSIKRGDDCFFQVTAELCPSQTDKNASIWHVRDNKIKKIWSKKTDIYPQLFMPGTVNFPNGIGIQNEFYFHCNGVSGSTGKTFKYSIDL